MKRALILVLAAVALAGPPAVSQAAGDPCAHRMLVLSAFPGEMDNLIANATVTETVVVEEREFFVGTLRGNDVILALTGIGLVNAERTTKLALGRFQCGDDALINRIVFSGVSGGATYIGDVTIPERWTIDDGKSWIGVDQSMFDIARHASDGVHLASDVPLGDLACAGLDPDLVRTVHLDHAPAILVGGDGKSTDPFGGRRLPCVPGGGDVFGCRPCRAPGIAPGDPQRAITDGSAFLDPNFFFGYFASPPPPTSTYRAEDMETAAVARVAAAHEIPFLAFRALSDGLGDPLMLPGFPFQFFFYRQIAADNAATMTLAFLDAWAKQ